MPKSKEALNKFKNDSNNSITPKYKVGDKITLSKRQIKISYGHKGISSISVLKDGDSFLLWKESSSYLDLLGDSFEVVIKKVIVLNNKISYVCRLSILEKE